MSPPVISCHCVLKCRFVYHQSPFLCPCLALKQVEFEFKQ